MVEAYPLYWPEGWKRAKTYKRSAFKTGFEVARQQLSKEIARMGGSKVVISTNVPLRNDGMPRASAPEPADKGVAVYFVRQGKNMALACDRYDQTRDNIYAIAKTIEALRAIERWGASDMMERAFTGFKQLAAENSGESWWKTLGVAPEASMDEIQEAYRFAIKVFHPDRPGGSHEAMTKLNLARDQALNARR